MDVRFSSEQQALRDSAAQIVDRLGPKSVRDLEDAERAAKLDAAVEASGWRELRSAADEGRPVASGVEVAIIAEELGRGLGDVAFLGPTLAAELRRVAGAPPASAPETVGMAPDLSRLAGETEGGELRAVAVEGSTAKNALVLVAVPGGHAVAQLALSAPGGGMDLTRPVTVVGEDSPAELLPGATRVLSGPDLKAWTALGLAVACADLVGVMRGVIGAATEYASSRRQYGVAIGSFQAVQHMLADSLVAMEGSRSVALHAAWAVDALPVDEALGSAAVAKAYCARAARAVCETGIQVHGGIGNTWECLAHVYLRRALLAIDFLGGVGPSLARVLEHSGIGGTHGLR